MKTCQKPSRTHSASLEGTETGAKRHRRHGEDPCPECAAGEKAAQKIRYARRKAKLEAERQKTYRAWDPERDLSCEMPTPSSPNGARGTTKGFSQHRTAGTEPCAECLEAQRAHGRAKYHATKDQYREKRNAYAAARREAKREELREYDRRYYQEHKDRSRVIRRARHTRAKATWDGHTTETIIKAHGSDCYLCGTPVDPGLPVGYSDSPQRDHVVPLTDPESPGDVIENVRLTHARCNLAKSCKRVEDLDLPFMPPGHEAYKSADTEKEEAHA